MEDASSLRASELSQESVKMTGTEPVQQQCNSQPNLILLPMISRPCILRDSVTSQLYLVKSSTGEKIGDLQTAPLVVETMVTASDEAISLDDRTTVLPGPSPTVVFHQDPITSTQVIHVDPQPDTSHTTLHTCRWQHCTAEFPSLEELVYHVTDRHIRMESHECYRCGWADCQRNGKEFSARYKILAHVRTHTNEKPHVCPICGKQFARVENLKIHKRTHTGEKPYLCPYEGCSKAYSNSSDRFKHARTHQTERPYVCKAEGCGKCYTDPSSLRKHMKSHRHKMKSGTEPVPPGSIEDVQSTLTFAEQVSPSILAGGTSLSCSNPMLSSSADKDSLCPISEEQRLESETLAKTKEDFVVDGSQLMQLPQDILYSVRTASQPSPEM